jgi:hypothetical protein
LFNIGRHIICLPYFVNKQLFYSIFKTIKITSNRRFFPEEKINLTFKGVSITNNNQKHINLQFTLPFKKQSSFNHFTVKSDISVIYINRITLVDNANQSATCLTNSVSKDSKAHLSYISGTVLSISETRIDNYTDFLFDNLLSGNSLQNIEHETNPHDRILLSHSQKSRQNKTRKIAKIFL